MLLSSVAHQLLLLKTFQAEEIFYLECSTSSSPALKSWRLKWFLFMPHLVQLLRGISCPLKALKWESHFIAFLCFTRQTLSNLCFKHIRSLELAESSGKKLAKEKWFITQHNGKTNLAGRKYCYSLDRLKRGETCNPNGSADWIFYVIAKLLHSPPRKWF